MSFRMGPDLIEYYDDDHDMGPFCAHCGWELEYEACDRCGGDGFLDSDVLMEEDPLWYGPDDTERCEACQGKGGWHFCSNRECPGKRDETPSSSGASE